jgi:hypothetical protein
MGWWGSATTTAGNLWTSGKVEGLVDVESGTAASGSCRCRPSDAQVYASPHRKEVQRFLRPSRK